MKFLILMVVIFTAYSCVESKKEDSASVAKKQVLNKNFVADYEIQALNQIFEDQFLTIGTDLIKSFTQYTGISSLNSKVERNINYLGTNWCEEFKSATVDNSLRKVFGSSCISECDENGLFHEITDCSKSDLKLSCDGSSSDTSSMFLASQIVTDVSIDYGAYEATDKIDVSGNISGIIDSANFAEPLTPFDCKFRLNYIFGVTKLPTCDVFDIYCEIGEGENKTIATCEHILPTSPKVISVADACGSLVENVDVEKFVQITPSTSIDNAILISDASIFSSIEVGDYISVTGSSNSANNLTHAEILEKNTYNDKNYIIVETDLSSEIDREAIGTIEDDLYLEVDVAEIFKTEKNYIVIKQNPSVTYKMQAGDNITITDSENDDLNVAAIVTNIDEELDENQNGYKIFLDQSVKTSIGFETTILTFTNSEGDLHTNIEVEKLKNTLFFNLMLEFSSGGGSDGDQILPGDLISVGFTHESPNTINGAIVKSVSKIEDFVYKIEINQPVENEIFDIESGESALAHFTLLKREKISNIKISNFEKIIEEEKEENSFAINVNPENVLGLSVGDLVSIRGANTSSNNVIDAKITEFKNLNSPYYIVIDKNLTSETSSFATATFFIKK